jgi:hypothetical protein
MQLSDETRQRIESTIYELFASKPVNRIVYKCGIDVIGDHWLETPLVLPMQETIYAPVLHGDRLTHVELWSGNEFLMRAAIGGMGICPVGVDLQISLSFDLPQLETPDPIERIPPRQVEVEECPDCGAPLGTCDRPCSGEADPVNF